MSRCTGADAGVVWLGDAVLDALDVRGVCGVCCGTAADRSGGRSAKVRVVTNGLTNGPTASGR
ncbi:hypothetical protein QR77_17050 [Streptomyces sp. 150FB]|uniref:hypothetical protein n=1 Tax=Streptomyces sp. 150FB TaxID=1576605 RepID=UPI000588F834|nr:hypothetical protein [Streptomyces sp. 150FB]KIF75171.1 hypothetical protein QR77_17050 [Streptomyces sp. 150FB]